MLLASFTLPIQEYVIAHSWICHYHSWIWHCPFRNMSLNCPFRNMALPIHEYVIAHSGTCHCPFMNMSLNCPFRNMSLIIHEYVIAHFQEYVIAHPEIWLSLPIQEHVIAHSWICHCPFSRICYCPSRNMIVIANSGICHCPFMNMSLPIQEYVIVNSGICHCPFRNMSLPIQEYVIAHSGICHCPFRNILNCLSFVNGFLNFTKPLINITNKKTLPPLGRSSSTGFYLQEIVLWCVDNPSVWSTIYIYRNFTLHWRYVAVSAACMCIPYDAQGEHYHNDLKCPWWTQTSQGNGFY